MASEKARALHGLVFVELKKFVISKAGTDGWTQLAASAGLVGNVYLASRIYPDQEALSLVGAAAKQFGKSAPEILESFGEFIGPHLLQLYRTHVDPSWSTLDLLERTEENIHRIVRVKEQDAKPPILKARRVKPNVLQIEYVSPRRLCHLAVGIARGVAADRGESIDIEQLKCVHRGDPSCLLEFRVEPPA